MLVKLIATKLIDFNDIFSLSDKLGINKVYFVIILAIIYTSINYISGLCSISNFVSIATMIILEIQKMNTYCNIANTAILELESELSSQEQQYKEAMSSQEQQYKEAMSSQEQQYKEAMSSLKAKDEENKLLRFELEAAKKLLELEAKKVLTLNEEKETLKLKLELKDDQLNALIGVLSRRQ